jgi:hypothetical protein
MRLASLNRARDDLGIEPLWSMPLGDFDLIGVTSSLVGFPTFEPEALPAERSQWRALRTEHLEAIETTVSRIPAHRRIILFCHDPTALPFLAELPSMRRVLPRVECTFIGHLHSPLVLWKSRLLSGMPSLRFLGNSVRRMSSALNRAALWKPFHVRLCPSLAGIQLLKDGGYWEVRLGPTPTYRFHPIPWTPPRALAPGEPAP